MSNPAPPHAKTAAVICGASYPTERAPENLSRYNPRNPLISQDSGERIQGNPSNSNRRQWGISRRNGPTSRKSESTDRANLPAAKDKQVTISMRSI
jgi:hypothetical protein